MKRTTVGTRVLGGRAFDGGEYYLHHWEGGCSGTALDCVVQMSQARTVTAVFVKTSSGDPPSGL